MRMKTRQELRAEKDIIDAFHARFLRDGENPYASGVLAAVLGKPKISPWKEDTVQTKAYNAGYAAWNTRPLRGFVPEGCRLQAYFDEGWILEVVDASGNVIAILEWPEQWKGKKSEKQLQKYGFEIV